MEHVDALIVESLLLLELVERVEVDAQRGQMLEHVEIVAVRGTTGRRHAVCVTAAAAADASELVVSTAAAARVGRGDLVAYVAL